MTEEKSSYGLDAHRVAVEAAALVLQMSGGRFASHFRALVDQLVRAATSVPLNLAEGNGRLGKDRRYHFSVAYASAKEASTALMLLRAASAMDHHQASQALGLLDRVQAMTWRLMRPG